ncbi:MAG: serine hydroxymethyltransferase [Phycisphaerales bacterium]|nr:serine hydroxymethyltransferase [Phycisphaerales bacterium]
MTTQATNTAQTIDSAVLDVIARTDPSVAEIIRLEMDRQEHTIELIASENHASPATMLAGGTCMTNKYAEGYPGRRYYGGCAHHDTVEQLARDRAQEMFGCKFVNVQPHSGAQANTAAFMAMMEPGDTFLSLVLKDGGHLSHGMFLNFSGIFYKPVHYALHYDKDHPQHEQIDYDSVLAAAKEHKPKMILCGYSAYPRVIDFAKFREIADEVGATLMADIAHISGLVAAGVHPSPFPHAHIVTTTTHKSLRGPRGGLIMTNDEDLNKLINRNVFPGVQGGPLMHIITAKAVAFGEALTPEFKLYQQQVVKNAQALAAAMIDNGFRITSGGTDNHLMLVDLTVKDADLTGKEAEKWLEAAGIITNKNGIPDDPRSPMITSGLRLGTPATTTRGFGETEMKQIADWIDRVIVSKGDEAMISQVRSEVRAMCVKHPLTHALV